MIKYLVPLAAFAVLPSCVDNSNAGISARRNQSSSMVSHSEYSQRTRQRSDQADELQTQRALRQDRREQITDPLRTTNDVLGGLNQTRWLLNGLTR